MAGNLPLRASGPRFFKKTRPHGLWGLIFLSIITFSCSQKDKREYSRDLPRFSHLNLDSTRYNVAFLIMDGVYNTELTAPFDIFHHTILRDNIKAMKVFTIANTAEPIKTFEGLMLIPDLNYLEDSLPKIDMLVVPSAENHLSSDLEDEKMLELVRRVSDEAQFVMSHCDGAFVLAESGVLEGRESTTFPADIPEYRQRYPGLVVHDSVLFVHDGKFITSVGGAKSFEASLYLIELLYGKKVADEIAEGMVIDWDLNSIPFVIVE